MSKWRCGFEPTKEVSVWHDTVTVPLSTVRLAMAADTAHQNEVKSERKNSAFSYDS